jgi:hypothetical protein
MLNLGVIRAIRNIHSGIVRCPIYNPYFTRLITLCISVAEIAQVAYSQGDSTVFSLLSNRLRLGYEYTSEFQANYTVPYNSSIYCCDCPETFGTWTAPSTADQYQYRPVREIAYGYFNGVAGQIMPYTKDILTLTGGDTINPVNADNDNAEWGALRFRRTASL